MVNQYTNFAVVTPSNSVDIPVGRVRGIMISKSTDAFANVAIHNEAKASVTIAGLSCGVIHPISTTRILVTGTTATTITVFW